MSPRTLVFRRRKHAQSNMGSSASGYNQLSVPVEEIYAKIRFTQDQIHPIVTHSDFLL